MTGQYFDIAHYTGHKALDELKMCYLIYELPIAQVLRLNNINIQFMDFKSKSDIYEIIETTSIADLDISKLDGINCNHLSSVCPFSLNCAQAVEFQLYASTIL